MIDDDIKKGKNICIVSMTEKKAIYYYNGLYFYENIRLYSIDEVMQFYNTLSNQILFEYENNKINIKQKTN